MNRDRDIMGERQSDAQLNGSSVEELPERDAKQPWQAILAGINDHLVCFDRQWRYTYVNDKAAEVLGKTPAQLLGNCIWELFPEAVGNQFHSELHAAVAEQRIVRSEHYYAPFDAWFENHIYPSPDGVTVYASDISWRKRLEQAQREQESLLRTVGDNLPGAIYQVATGADGVRRFQYISAGIEALLGIKPADIIADAMTLYSLILPEDIGRVVVAEEQAYLTQTPFDCEFRQRTTTGEIRWMHCRSAPRHSPTGDIVWDGVVLDVTARKLAEQALERYRLLAEHTRDIVLFMQTDGRIVEANAAATEAYGYSREELLELRIDDLRDPETVHLLPQQLRDADQHGTAFETRHRRRDGTMFPVDVSARGTAIGEERVVMSIIRDIRERRRVEAATRELAAIVESSGDAIISKNLDGIITSWNAGATLLYGYTAQEMIGQPIYRLIPPELYDEEAIILASLRQGEKQVRDETVRIAKNGRRIEVSITMSPIKDERGVVIGASKIARDISERKRSEATLRFLSEASAVLASSLDYEATLASVAMLSVPTLSDWCTIDVLEDDGQLHRLAVAHVDPQKIRLAHEVHRDFPADPATSSLWRIARGGESELVSEITDAMLVAAIPDARLLGILRELGLKSYLGVPLRIRDRTLGVLTFIAAESGRRFTAADLALAEDLAHRAAVAIENARLYGQVHEASRRKDEFLATLAHELRNPLAPIRNAMQLFRLAGALDPDLEHAREIVDRQVDQLTRLVDDLLDVSRFSRGKIELRRQVVLLSTIVERALEMSRPLLDASQHKLTMHTCNQPLTLHADPTRIAQVIANLLNNSAKYTEPGGNVFLSIEREGNEAVICVRDNGVGIPREMLTRVFEPFTQVDTSLERRQGGLGIGLSLVQKLVELHAGSITADSPGRGLGCTFTVRLPLITTAIEEPINVPPVALPAPSLKPQGRRILVADDNKDSADTLSMLLRLLGNEVRTVYNGPAALQAAEDYQPTVLVLDIGMPDMSGYEVARRLRSHSTFQNALLVAMTGWGQEEDRRRTREAGFDYHLVKPVELKELEDLLQRIPIPN